MKICGGDFNPEKGLTPDDCGLPVLHAEGVNTTPAGLPGRGPRNKRQPKPRGQALQNAATAQINQPRRKASKATAALRM